MNNLDPNGASLIDWPAYTVDAPALLTFLEGNTSQVITSDAFRVEGIQAISQATVAGIRQP